MATLKQIDALCNEAAEVIEKLMIEKSKLRESIERIRHMAKEPRFKSAMLRLILRETEDALEINEQSQTPPPLPKHPKKAGKM